MCNFGRSGILITDLGVLQAMAIIHSKFTSSIKKAFLIEYQSFKDTLRKLGLTCSHAKEHFIASCHHADMTFNSYSTSS